jgi:hypothetical protein
VGYDDDDKRWHRNSQLDYKLFMKPA